MFCEREYVASVCGCVQKHPFKDDSNNMLLKSLTSPEEWTRSCNCVRTVEAFAAFKKQSLTISSLGKEEEK